VFDAVDSIGSVIIVGGETFLYPNINKIFKKILSKNNFGNLTIPTNGMLKIDKRQIEVLNDKRVRLAFSNYIGSVSPKHEEILYKNIETAKSMGINVQLQNTVPSWYIPGTFEKRSYSETQLEEMKNTCMYKCYWTYNGKVFMCTYAITVNNLLETNEDDYVDIDSTKSNKELHDKMLKLSKLRYYPSCVRCGNTKTQMTEMAAEQGFDERYSLEHYKYK
jgi:hypothetical protein